EMVKACVTRGGVLSGEHGIGLEKRDLMPMLFTQSDLDAQARVKEVFDPKGIFNPTKVLPEGSRCFDLGSRYVPDGAWVRGAWTRRPAPRSKRWHRPRRKNSLRSCLKRRAPAPRWPSWV